MIVAMRVMLQPSSSGIHDREIWQQRFCIPAARRSQLVSIIMHRASGKGSLREKLRCEVCSNICINTRCMTDQRYQCGLTPLVSQPCHPQDMSLGNLIKHVAKNLMSTFTGT